MHSMVFLMCIQMMLGKFSKSFDKLLTNIRFIFQRLCDKQLQAKHPKCGFLHSSLHFLGHIVSSESVSPSPGKVTATAKLADPANIHTLNPFHG